MIAEGSIARVVDGCNYNRKSLCNDNINKLANPPTSDDDDEMEIPL